MVYDLKYAERVRKQLLGKGSIGMSTNDLHQKTRTPTHTADELDVLLRAWQKRGWVDSFRVSNGGRGGVNKRIWRATDTLLTEWPVIQIAIRELMTGGHHTVQGLVQERNAAQAEELPETSTD